MSGLRRIRERKLVQWGAAYLAGAWLCLQVLDLLGGFFGWPVVAGRIATVLLGVGFVAALVLAWFHGEKGAQRVSGPELVMMISLLVLAGAAVAFVGGGTEAARTATQAASGSGDAGSAVDLERAGASASPAAGVEQGSIAVLPFADMSPDKDQEYFTDGMTEEILNVLAKIPELRVAARTSSFAFKGRSVAIDSVARALRVAHVLEGSVRKAGDQLRITAQLIDARTGYHLWSESYDRELKDVFAVQDEIAHAIVDALQLEIGGGRSGLRLAEEETADPEAYALVLRGRHLARQTTREGYRQAIAQFRRAITRDPAYARARALLARTYSAQVYRGYGSDDLLREARVEAERALALDPNSAEAHLALGQITHQHGAAFRAAEAHYRRAVELNPGLAEPHDVLGWLLMELGQLEEAIGQVERAAELDPLSPPVLNSLGIMYLYAGQPRRALETLQLRVELDPNPLSLASVGLIHALLGRLDEATDAVERAHALEPEDRWVLAAGAFVHARAGRRAQAEKGIRTLEAQRDSNPFLIAIAYAGLGETERMFELLERAVAERSSVTSQLRYMPVFDPYRDDPRMRELIARLDEG